MTAAASARSDALAASINEIAGRLRRSTLRVIDGRGSFGSGVLWDDNGTVVTNAHVVHGNSTTIEFYDGSRANAEVIRRDSRRDLAALRLNSPSARHAEPADHVGSGTLRPGEIVFAVGNPMGIAGACTTGVIHSIGPAEGFEHQPWIQADVRLAPGNSGGPLADTRGRVVGINSMIVHGLGLAVPSDSVAKFLRGEEDQLRIGVTVEPVGVPLSSKNLLGLYVSDVDRRSLAEQAGIQKGDILIGYDARAFRKPTDLLVALRGTSSRVPLDVLRGGRQIRLEVDVPR